MGFSTITPFGTRRTIPFSEKAAASRWTESAPRSGPERLEKPSRAAGRLRRTWLNGPKITPLPARSSPSVSMVVVLSASIPLAREKPPRESRDRGQNRHRSSLRMGGGRERYRSQASRRSLAIQSGSHERSSAKAWKKASSAKVLVPPDSSGEGVSVWFIESCGSAITPRNLPFPSR